MGRSPARAGKPSLNLLGAPGRDSERLITPNTYDKVRADNAPLRNNGDQSGCPHLVRQLSSLAAVAVQDAICAAATAEDLDRVTRDFWRAHAEGSITEGDAEVLDAQIRTRRPIPRAAVSYALRKARGRLASRFVPRRCRKRLSDEARTKRRRLKRMLGGSSAMPGAFAQEYTEGERAVLCVVAGEIK